MKRQELSQERTRLVGFIKTALHFIQGLSPDNVPAFQEFGRIKWDDVPVSGIRIAARDVVEWLQDIKGDQLLRLDAELCATGLPTLTAMRRAEYRRAVTVLERGRILNEAEWHLLNSLLADTDDGVLAESDRQKAGRLAHEYEFRRSSTPKPQH